MFDLTSNQTEECVVSYPALVEPADELTIDEVRRYSRHLIIPDVGMTGQKRLKNAKVLVIGAGGLGSLDGVHEALALELTHADVVEADIEVSRDSGSRVGEGGPHVRRKAASCRT